MRGGGQMRQLQSERGARTRVILRAIKNSKLGRSGGMLPHFFLTLQPLRQFLVASEHSDGEKPVSDIPPFNSQMSGGE